MKLKLKQKKQNNKTIKNNKFYNINKATFDKWLFYNFFIEYKNSGISKFSNVVISMLGIVDVIEPCLIWFEE